MSIRVQLVCDVCDGDFGSDAGVSDESVVSLRDDSAVLGWVRAKVAGTKWDVCPRCVGRHEPQNIAAFLARKTKEAAAEPRAARGA